MFCLGLGGPVGERALAGLPDPGTRSGHANIRRAASRTLNGRVRRFLPRESPPEALARARLCRLADRLNDTPRRCLGYRTPREVFQQHLAAPPGPP